MHACARMHACAGTHACARTHAERTQVQELNARMNEKRTHVRNTHVCAKYARMCEMHVCAKYARMCAIDLQPHVCGKIALKEGY